MPRIVAGLQIVVSAGLCVLLTGCWGLPADAPEAITKVLADPESFTAPEDDPLQDVEAGSVIDDLAELGGCWGTYGATCDPNGSGTCLIAGQTLHFTPDTGGLIRYTYQDLGGLRVLDIWEGTYAVVDGGHLTCQVERVFSNVPAITSITEITDRFATLPSYDVYVTLSGDELKAIFATPADDPRTPAGFLEDAAFIHQQFDCPE